MPPPLTKKRFCVIGGCRAEKSTKYVQQHKFPQNSKLRQQWCDFVLRTRPSTWKLSSDCRICSKHFELNCFNNIEAVGATKAKLTLMEGVVPTKIPSCKQFKTPVAALPKNDLKVASWSDVIEKHDPSDTPCKIGVNQTEKGVAKLVTCPRSCRINCSNRHHPVLVAMLNCADTAISADMADRLKDLSAIIKRYKESTDWDIDDPIPDCAPCNQQPLLIWACAVGHTCAMNMLLKMGVDVRVTSSEGDSCLQFALQHLTEYYSTHDSAFMMERIIAGPLFPVVMITNHSGDNFIHRVCDMIANDISHLMYPRRALTAVVKNLLRLEKAKRHKILNCQNDNGDSYLHILCRSEHWKLEESQYNNNRDVVMRAFKQLILCGINTSLRNKEGKTPLEVASEVDKFQVVLPMVIPLLFNVDYNVQLYALKMYGNKSLPFDIWDVKEDARRFGIGPGKTLDLPNEEPINVHDNDELANISRPVFIDNDPDDDDKYEEVPSDSDTDDADENGSTQCATLPDPITSAKVEDPLDNMDNLEIKIEPSTNDDDDDTILEAVNFGGDESVVAVKGEQDESTGNIGSKDPSDIDVEAELDIYLSTYSSKNEALASIKHKIAQLERELSWEGDRIGKELVTLSNEQLDMISKFKFHLKNVIDQQSDLETLKKDMAQLKEQQESSEHLYEMHEERKNNVIAALKVLSELMIEEQKEFLKQQQRMARICLAEDDRVHPGRIAKDITPRTDVKIVSEKKKKPEVIVMPPPRRLRAVEPEDCRAKRYKTSLLSDCGMEIHTVTGTQQAEEISSGVSFTTAPLEIAKVEDELPDVIMADDATDKKYCANDTIDLTEPDESNQGSDQKGHVFAVDKEPSQRTIISVFSKKTPTTKAPPRVVVIDKNSREPAIVSYRPPFVRPQLILAQSDTDSDNSDVINTNTALNDIPRSTEPTTNQIITDIQENISVQNVSSEEQSILEELIKGPLNDKSVIVVDRTQQKLLKASAGGGEDSGALGVKNSGLNLPSESDKYYQSISAITDDEMVVGSYSDDKLPCLKLKRQGGAYKLMKLNEAGDGYDFVDPALKESNDKFLRVNKNSMRRVPSTSNAAQGTPSGSLVKPTDSDNTNTESQIMASGAKSEDADRVQIDSADDGEVIFDIVV